MRSRPAPVPPRSEPLPEPPADLMYLAEEWTLPPSGTPSGGDGLRVDKGSPRHRVVEAGDVELAAPSMTRLVTHTMDPRPRPGGCRVCACMQACAWTNDATCMYMYKRLHVHVYARGGGMGGQLLRSPLHASPPVPNSLASYT